MSLSHIFMDSDDSADLFFELSSSTSPALAERSYSEILSAALSESVVESNQKESSNHIPSEPWYNEDQLFVFKAGDKIFQVPQKPFSSKSPVFNTFLSSPKSDSKLFKRSVPVSGHPVIHCLDVSGIEATYFFKALYDAEFFEGPPKITNLEVILAIFKLSSKYEVQFLRRRALAHLELAYPNRALSDWDSRQEGNITTFSIEKSEHPEIVSHTLSGTLEIIELCTVYTAPWILPTAFYEASLYDLTSLLGHPKWLNGSLTENLKKTILLGHLSHREESSRVLSFLHIRNLDICGNHPVCVDYRQDSLKTIYTDSTQPRQMQDFFGNVWDRDDWDEAGFRGMCDTCLRICQARHQLDRSAAWVRLPMMYGQLTWEKLQVLRDSTMDPK